MTTLLGFCSPSSSEPEPLSPVEPDPLPLVDPVAEALIWGSLFGMRLTSCRSDWPVLPPRKTVKDGRLGYDVPYLPLESSCR